LVGWTPDDEDEIDEIVIAVLESGDEIDIAETIKDVFDCTFLKTLV